MISDGLLIIDLQNGLQTETNRLYKIENVLAGVNERIAAYRQAEKPVIFVQHTDEELIHGSDSWHLMPELEADATDFYVEKTHANSFYQTSLQSLLADLAIEKLEICGAQTQFCVDTTIRFAHGLGYQLFMQHGLNTTLDTELLKAETIIAHHESLWNQRFLTFFN